MKEIYQLLSYMAYENVIENSSKIKLFGCNFKPLAIFKYRL